MDGTLALESRVADLESEVAILREVVLSLRAETHSPSHVAPSHANRAPVAHDPRLPGHPEYAEPNADYTANQPAPKEPHPACGCWQCLTEWDERNPSAGLRAGDRPLATRFMVVCRTCGNKRCPHATNHVNACTGSNASGQPGSRYATTWPPSVEKINQPAPNFGGPSILLSHLDEQLPNYSPALVRDGGPNGGAE